MKKLNQIKFAMLTALFVTIGFSSSLKAQCIETLGSASNMLSTYENNPNQIIVNNDLNTVIFIHRNDISTFGGDNGVFRYDISTDNGSTWQLNQGYLNPNSAAGVNGGRYPQVGIYNPPGNTELSNTTLVYHGPTVASIFEGYVSGSLLLDGVSSSTENYNQAGVTNTNVPGGFCQSTPGTFWTVDQILDGGVALSGIRILKGTYDSGDVTWSVNTELTPDFNLDYGSPLITDWNMAFDPSGTYGWVVMLSHLNGLPDYNYHPVFYNTNDGGATWNGPIQLDLTSFPSITAVEPNPGCGFEVDIEVDANGNPHALVGVFNSAGGYSVFLGPGHMFDFTFNGSSWNAINIAQTSYTQLEDFSAGLVTNNRPQISRSDDGSKMVFTWVDSDIPAFLGIQPNLKAVTYDVTTGTISCPVIYSAKCPSSLNGQMYQTTVSPNMIEEGGVYTVPVVLAIRNASGSGNDPAQYYYLNDLSFSNADFTAPQSGIYPTITINGSNPICGGGSVELIADAQSSYLWNTGESTQSITVTEGGKYWVINPDVSYCIGSSNSVTIEVIFPADITPFGSTYLCGGATVELFANYYTGGTDFLWSTGETTQSIIVSDAGSYVVTVDGGCPSFPLEVQVSTDPYRPTISYTTLSVCFPETITLTANTNSNYLWNTGETTQSIEVDFSEFAYFYGPSYWVVNPDINSCVDNTNTVDVFINLVEVGPFYGEPITICQGNTIDLFAYSYVAEGQNYLWSNGETTQTITVGASGTYFATVDGCASYNSVEIISTAPPANDNICNAQTLTIGAVTAFNNTCATIEAGEVAPGAGTGIDPCTSQDGWCNVPDFGEPGVTNSVWFSFIAPASGAVNISSSFDNYPFDTQLALYSSSNYSCNGTLSLVAANDDSGNPGFEFSSFINRAFCLKKGKRYFVQVDGFAGLQGSGTIKVTAVPNTVTICHKPQNGNPVTLSVSGCSLAAHLAHGDQIGACPAIRVSTTNDEDISSVSLLVYPNPSNDIMNVSFSSDNEEAYTMKVIDVTGRVILSQDKVALIGENEEQLDLQSINPGLYFLTIYKGENVIQTRIVKQ